MKGYFRMVTRVWGHNTSTTVKAARRMRLMGVSLRLTWRATRRPIERRKAGKSIQELPCTASFTPGVNSSTAPLAK